RHRPQSFRLRCTETILKPMAAQFNTAVASIRDARRTKPTAPTASALFLFLLAIDGGLHDGCRARIFPSHLAKGGAGSLLLLQRRKRLSEPQHRIGRLGRLVILGRHGEE